MNTDNNSRRWWLTVNPGPQTEQTIIEYAKLLTHMHDTRQYFILATIGKLIVIGSLVYCFYQFIIS